jgi:glycerophosphoryl diester phosphodiesterase
VKSPTRNAFFPIACGAIAAGVLTSIAIAAEAPGDDAIQLGERPFYLIDGMDDGPLKTRLQQCRGGPFRRSDFSIAHRGAPLKFPEHTREAYEAGARMGAGIVECDVTFTKDGELVCRHDECDLATTTDIVVTALNKSCSVPYAGKGSSPRCCASDLTLAEFRTLKGKMESADPEAADAAGFLGGVPGWREAPDGIRGTLLTLRESIALNERLEVKHTPELKAGDPERIKQVFGSQGAYAQKMIDEFKQAGVDASDVFPQSFNLEDIRYWIKNEPAFGRQAVYLDDVDPTANSPRLTLDELKQLRTEGVRILAPPIPALLEVYESGKIVPTQYARDIRAAGLGIIAWTFERSDLRSGAATAGWYWAFDPQGRAIKKDSDMYLALDVLAREVGVRGMFSDWPATVTYYANCMGAELQQVAPMDEQP